MLIDFPCSREETQLCTKITVCETLLIHKLMHYNQRELMIIGRSSLNPSNLLGQLRCVSTLNTNFIRKLLQSWLEFYVSECLWRAGDCTPAHITITNANFTAYTWWITRIKRNLSSQFNDWVYFCVAIEARK